LVQLLRKKVNCTLKDIYDKILIFVLLKIPNPKFTSQVKSELASTPETVKFIKNRLVVNENQLKQVLKWDIVQKLKEKLEQKEIKKEKTDERKKDRILLGDKLRDANWAGTVKNSHATLFIVEGQSAMNFVSEGRSTVQNGQDKIGIYSIRGKFKNVYNSTLSDMNTNKEIKELKQVLGLKSGVDFCIESNFTKLRYGQVCILTDADKDGFHICGLLLNFFFCKFKSLWDKNYFTSLSTPILKAHFSDKSLSFFSQKEFEMWKKKTKNPGKYTIRYYKGLGTSKPKDAIEAFKKNKKINYFLTDKSEEFVKLAFDSKSSNDRKTWLGSESEAQERYEGDLSFDQFIDTGLKSFHLENIKRSLPSMFDGLKESQRKILYGAMLKKSEESIKVTQLQGRITEKTEYKYGDASLVETIIKMAQNFVGSNNIPLFVRDGNFGSRVDGGDDAAQGRYIYTKLESIVYRLFPQIDFEFLQRVEEDGVLLEPKFYIPIIPMLLVNGCTGIGTGFSTFIPNFCPIDIITWIQNWLDGKPPTQLQPSYNGFKGQINILDDDTMLFETIGCVEKIKDNQFRITELPIGVWTNKYKEYLESLLLEEKIEDYKDLNSPTQVNFLVKCNDPDILKLSSKMSMKNSIYLDEKSLPKKIHSLEVFLTRWCESRLDLYRQRREKIVRDINYNLNVSESKKLFINAIVEGTLDLSNSEQYILDFLQSRDFFRVNNSFSYLLDLTVRNFTQENLEKTVLHILELKKQLESTKNLTEKNLWKIDLDFLLQEYKEYLKIEKLVK
jgi:DNA topoisomerase II